MMVEKFGAQLFVHTGKRDGDSIVLVPDISQLFHPAKNSIASFCDILGSMPTCTVSTIGRNCMLLGEFWGLKLGWQLNLVLAEYV